jgi:hypothetical protein
MMSFNKLPLILLVLLLIMLSASLVFAETEQTNPSNTTTTGRLVPLTLNGTTVAGLSDITSDYSRGIRLNFGVQSAALAPGGIIPNLPSDPIKTSSHEPMIFSFYKSEATKLGVSPLSDRFNLNPIADLMNMEVMWQYKF